jgi:hypothetical protein
MIRVFDVDEPTTEIELHPDTVVRTIDIKHYLTTGILRFIGEPKPAQQVALSDAMVVETGFEEDHGATVVIRVASREERGRLARMH